MSREIFKLPELHCECNFINLCVYAVLPLVLKKIKLASQIACLIFYENLCIEFLTMNLHY